MTNGHYASDVAQLQSDLDTDIRAITGQASTVKLIGPDSASWTKNTAGTRCPQPTPQALLTLDASYPTRFACSGPMYPYLYDPNDGIHCLDGEHRRMGERMARAAIRDAAGLSTALYITAASRSGATVTLTFGTAEGQLVLDTSFVTDPGTLGIYYRDGSDASVSVSAVQVVGTNQIQFTLASAVAGTVGIATEGTAGAAAGATSGPRSCIRDTVTATGSDGLPMHNYACIQLFAVA